MLMMNVEMKPGTDCQDCDSEHRQGRIGRLSSQCERNLSIIRRQCEEIEELKQELDKVVTERDILLCEVSKLKFDIQVVDLKRTISDHNEGGVSVSVGCHLHRLSPEMAGYMNSNSNNNNSNNNNNTTWTQLPSGNLHKKGSMTRENGEVLKRSRLQTAYELSQDLLDKQIEMLERKYGGVKARNAALTIQRAFRRYTLLKKFATITAMAKAEKRLSRRLAEPTDADGGGGGSSKYHHMSVAYHSEESRPLRSMSMRERRNADVMPLVRSQSGRCNADGAECYCPNNYCPNHTHYYVSEEAFLDSTEFVHENFSNRSTLVRRTIATSPLTSANCWQGVGGGMGPDPGIPRCGSSCSTHSYPFRGSSRGGGHCHKVPPEVPKRTSSISSRGPMEPTRPRRTNRLSKSRENGSLSSVQSSGSDSSLSTDRVTCESSEGDNHRGSPIWKRKGQNDSPDHQDGCGDFPLQELSRSHTSAAYQLPQQDHAAGPSSASQHTINKVSETVRKRQYRVGLNLFNKKPEKGVAYLIRRGFLENSPAGVSRFLISRKGLSKQMIGEYLGNLQNNFNMAVLDCFSQELDFSEMPVDLALRRYQTYFRMPGEAQKIERLMEVFGHRYCQCERDLVTALRSPDTVFVLAFAIIMLNTDLHTPNIKPERRMKLEDFIKNLRGIDDGADIDRDMLVGIYERVKSNEFKPGSDHVTQVMKVQSTIVGKKPNMALPHRRLVCYCRLYEIPDVSKKERPGVHQREVFLFNDLLVITKILSKKKSSVTYTFRQSFALCGMAVTLFEAQHYQFGIRLCQRVDSSKLLVTFNARNEHDRCKFAEDLRESISEMDEMENLRIDSELERQKSGRGGRSGGAASNDNRDSGVADVEGYPAGGGGLTPQGADEDEAGGGGVTGTDRGGRHHASQFRSEARPPLEAQLKRSALSNSLLDINEQCEKPQQRRGSMGSLDSGMSISFQSMTTSTLNHEAASPQNHTKTGAKVMVHQQSFLGGLFAKRERKSSRTEDSGPFSSRSTEV